MWTLQSRSASRRSAGAVAARDRLGAQSVKLSEHIKSYVAYTAKTNRTGYKDADVLARLLTGVGDRRLSDISSFQLEKWRTARAKAVSPSTVNRELNIVRGCFSRAVEWDCSRSRRRSASNRTGLTTSGFYC